MQIKLRLKLDETTKIEAMIPQYNAPEFLERNDHKHMWPIPHEQEKKEIPEFFLEPSNYNECI